MSGGIEGQLDKVDESGQALPLAMGVPDRDEDRRCPAAGARRGRPARQAGAARLPAGRRDRRRAARSPADRSGRLELARWLTHPDHPLTARVMVNRVWRHLFGAGLVRTVDNFGFSGERPSHPELLDNLAVRFVADGWSVKRLVREIVLSRTYRQASDLSTRTPSAPIRRTGSCGGRPSGGSTPRRSATPCSSSPGELDAARPVGSLVGERDRRSADLAHRPRSPACPPTSTGRGTGRSTCPCSATGCPTSSTCSTSPSRAWSPAIARRRTSPSRPST